MARFSVHGLDGLENMFSHISEIPYNVLEQMLDKQADILVRAQKETAAAMLQGEYYKGAVVKSIAKGPLKRKKDGLVRYIIFKGYQHGNRLAEIAFVNEYGKRGQPSRPFIQMAIEKCADETLNAAWAVFDKWIESI